MNILFTYPSDLGLRSFIKKDADILASNHSVELFPFNRLRTDAVRLLKAVNKTELVFNWFCGLHALSSNILAKLFRKPSITVVGGYEVAEIPKINYGQFVKGNQRYISILGLMLTNRVLTVSKFSESEVILNARISSKKIKTIYHGFTDDVFRREAEVDKQNLVITIAHITKMSSVNKGLDLFLESAKYLPDVKFVVIGPDMDGTGEKLKKVSPENVTFTGGLYGHDLARVCNHAKVYVQASIHESFGCSVAEAMLCGCVPVVTNAAALPEVVGKSGVFIERRNPAFLADKIAEALKQFKEKERQSIIRVKSKFPIRLRRYKVLEEIEGLMSR